MTNHQSLEQLLNDTDELLRCAKATAYESAESLSGSQRDHAFSVVHLIEMARCKMEDAVKFSHSAPHPKDAA